MHIGYILSIIFAVVWLGFKIAETIKQRKAEERRKETVIQAADSNIDDLIIEPDPDNRI